MKKIMNIALALVIGGLSIGAAITIPQLGDTQKTVLNTQAEGTPNLLITEISADAMQIEFASLDTANPDHVAREVDDVFEFVEIHNYGSGAINLKECALQVVSKGVTYQNEFLFEENNDGVLEGGETWVIFNYTTASFAYGPDDVNAYSLQYDTAEHLAAAWDEFNQFFGISVPVEHRVMSLSADTQGKAISGATAFPTLGDNDVQIVHKGSGEVFAKSSYTIATKGNSHNFARSETVGVGELLCVNGVTPYRLLREQDVTYLRTYDFSGEALRLVNYNLLFTGSCFDARASAFVDFLNTYSPDVLALQEIATEWYDYLHKVLPALGYTYIEVTVQTGGTVPTYASDSSNPIVYKTDKFNLVETGGTFVSETGERGGAKWDSVNRDRTINYAVLESKATGNRFTVLSTHGILTGDIAKIQHGNMAKALADEIAEKYNCPSLILGDLNMDEGSKYYQNMVSGTGYFDAKYLAMNSSYRLTCGNFGRYSYGATSYTNPWDQEANTIDYVLVPETVNVKNYKVIDDEYYNAAFTAEKPNLKCHISDHSAVLVDLYI